MRVQEFRSSRVSRSQVLRAPEVRDSRVKVLKDSRSLKALRVQGFKGAKAAGA